MVTFLKITPDFSKFYIRSIGDEKKKHGKCLVRKLPRVDKNFIS